MADRPHVSAVRADLLPVIAARPAEVVHVPRQVVVAVPTEFYAPLLDQAEIERRHRRRRRLLFGGATAVALLGMLWAGLALAGASPAAVGSAFAAVDWRVGAGLLGTAVVAALIARYWPRRCPGVVVHCQGHRRSGR